MSQKSSYIDRMEHFILNDLKRLSYSEVRLFLCLFYLNNKAMWEEWFEVGNKILSLFVGLDERNLLRTKKGLKTKGLIDFTPGKRGQPTKYKLFTPGELLSMSKKMGNNDIQTDILTDILTDIETRAQSLTPQGETHHLRHKTKDIRHIPPTPKGENAHFLTFWKAYPKKKDKKRAERAFLKLNPQEELLERIMAALEVQKNTPDWQKNGGQYIPMASTWLNGARWEDEITPAPSLDLTREEQEARRRAQREEEERYLKRRASND